MLKPTGTKSDLNLALKLAIVATRKSQREVAQLAGIGEIHLSKIVCNRAIPTADERRDLARVLRKPQHELFPMSDEAAAS